MIPLSKKISYILCIIIICLFIILKCKINNLNEVKEELITANNIIYNLKRDNANLLKYNLDKDNKIFEINKKYNDILKNIPQDNCGDAKPTKKLLNFLRNAENEVHK